MIDLSMVFLFLFLFLMLPSMNFIISIVFLIFMFVCFNFTDVGKLSKVFYPWCYFSLLILMMLPLSMILIPSVLPLMTPLLLLLMLLMMLLIFDIFCCVCCCFCFIFCGLYYYLLISPFTCVSFPLSSIHYHFSSLVTVSDSVHISTFSVLWFIYILVLFFCSCYVISSFLHYWVMR